MIGKVRLDKLLIQFSIITKGITNKENPPTKNQFIPFLEGLIFNIDSMKNQCQCLIKIVLLYLNRILVQNYRIPVGTGILTKEKNHKFDNL